MQIKYVFKSLALHYFAYHHFQILYYLENVNFTTSDGDRVYFDENGDALEIFDILSWGWLPDGSTKIHNVGVVKKTASGDEEITLDEDRIFWNFESAKVISASSIFKLSS